MTLPMLLYLTTLINKHKIQHIFFFFHKFPSLKSLYNSNTHSHPERYAERYRGGRSNTKWAVQYATQSTTTNWCRYSEGKNVYLSNETVWEIKFTYRFLVWLKIFHSFLKIAVSKEILMKVLENLFCNKLSTPSIF